MTTAEVIEVLKELGSEKSRQAYIKQGAGENQFEYNGNSRTSKKD
ncbi:hypothetical protein [Viridibacillus soli]|nr:hypothetical protein [Viridibacillus soli]